MKKLILCSALLLCIFPQHAGTVTHAEESMPLMDPENVSAVTASFRDAVPSGDGDTLLFAGNAVWYCNPSVSPEKHLFCSDPDCRHSSDDCSAYIGSAGSFIPYHGIWYYLRTQDDGTVQLIRHDPAAGTRTVLKTYTRSSPQEHFYVSLEMISHGDLFVRINGSFIDDSNGHPDHSETEMIDLETGKTRTVASVPAFVLGGDEEKFAVLQITDTFTDQAGQVHNAAQLCLYSRSDLSCTILAAEETGVSADDLSPGKVSGSTLLYAASNGLYALDLAAGTQRKIASGTVFSYALYGDSVYYAAGDDVSDADFFRCRTDGSNSVRMENDGLHHVRAFSICRATATGFYGMDSKGRYGWISRDDFDHERYEAMIEL